MEKDTNVTQTANETTALVKTETTEVKTETPTVSLVPTATEDEMSLTHLNKDFVYELMGIPTYSGYEFRLLTFIVLWARRNGVDYEFDDYGNLYLTKGQVEDGEYYPCMTAHLDSVQSKHKAYAQAGQNIEVKTRKIGGKHEIYVDGMGIGGDDKAGVLIGLSMFNHVDKLKACFFLEEETGCKGSNALNKEWFRDVGYVLGFDSPDLNRAAWACSGVKLFSAAFFKEHMHQICKDHGVTIFKSEPYTDVKCIREKTNIICMNFGSGYYNAHALNEYCVIEDMDNACRMGHALINHLGLQRFELEHKGYSYAYGSKADEDEAFLRTLSGTTTTYKPKSNRDYYYDDEFYDDDYYGYGDYYNNNQTTPKTSGATSTTSAATANQKVEKQGDAVPMETLKYVTEKYEAYIEMLKSDIKKKCEENDIDFSKFEDVFKQEIKF